MTKTSTTASVRRPADGVTVIEVGGEVTAASQQVLTEAYDDAGGEGTRLVVLDFAGLEYMNSGGIGMLVTLLVRAQRNHQRLAAVGLSAHYRQIFELTRLDEAIELHPDEASALAGA